MIRSLPICAVWVLVLTTGQAHADSLGPYVGLRVHDIPIAGGSESLVMSPLPYERRGSGVVVGKSTTGWFVLTNAHVVEPFEPNDTPAPDVYLAGAWRRGRVVGTDREADLALVVVRSPKRLRIVRLAESPPADGATVTTRAFASGTKWTKRECALRHALRLDDGRRARAPHTHFIDTTFQQGESGGAIISNGRLVGLIYGNDISHGCGLCVDYASIARFLSRWGWKPRMYAGVTNQPIGR